jgi:hypothetical protein
MESKIIGEETEHMKIHDMLSSIIDGDTEQTKELFSEIMREKVLDRIDAMRHEIGTTVFNKDEYVTEDWAEDDVYLALGRVVKALDDVSSLNESWDDMEDEEKSDLEDDDWYWDPLEGEEPIVEHAEKRHLKRYNEMYNESMDKLRASIMEQFRISMSKVAFADLREEIKPVAARLLVQVMEETYDVIGNIEDEEKRDTIAEAVTELFLKILPEELSLVPLPANYKKKGQSKSEYDANEKLAAKKKD